MGEPCQAGAENRLKRWPDGAVAVVPMRRRIERMKWSMGLTAGLALVVAVCGCRSTYYKAYEKLGVYKRDLLKKRVVAARDEEKATGEQFKDALTRLKELYAFQGGDLEKTYDKLKGEYDDSNTRAQAVHKRITDMETVAADLFREWENEIKEISSESMRSSSREQLRQTRERYEEMHTALKRAEKSMDPVLTKLRDHVLYLKHNLNAQAIASLKGESAAIQTDIARLIEDMNTSIQQADAFIKQMP
jgi:gas vesicle protein